MEAFVVQMEKEMIKERAMLFEVKMLFMRWSHPNVRRHYVQNRENIYFYVPRASS